MRPNDDEEKDDEDDISDIASVLPDEADWGGGIGRERANLEETFDGGIETVDNVGEEAGSRTDEPTEAANLV